MGGADTIISVIFLALVFLFSIIVGILLYSLFRKNRRIRFLYIDAQKKGQKIQHLEDQLEQIDNAIVKDREENFFISPEDIKRLKDKQDGDYYLTSLLIEPFIQNRGNDSSVQIDFILKQYKSFTFRKFQREIGGDVFLSGKIFLLKKKYTVLFNADAMGKSMQGAGGAIVTGASMQSILDRNRSHRNQMLTPERWLYETYRDLNFIFKSFQGNMIISMYLALLDDATGLLYYMNCDHPSTAIYRDNVADYIDNPMDYPKLGMSFGPRFFRVRLLKLEHGDVLVGGSDGRSDVFKEEDGVKTVYSMEDEHFLKIVEKNNARVPEIFESIQKMGKIADDITLFSLRYTPEINSRKILTRNEEEKIKSLFLKSEDRKKIKAKIKKMKKVLKINPENTDAMENLSELYYIKKLYKRSQYYAFQVLRIAPWNLKALLLYVKTSVKRQDYSNATSAYEILAFRYPDKITYHIKFAELKMKVRGYAHALKIINEVLDVKPEEKRASVLKKQILSRIAQK